MKGNRLKKTAWYTANIFIPLSETRLTMNTIIPSWKKQFQRIRVARKLMGRRQRNQTAYTWAEAVALTGMTPAQLEQRFLRRKRLYLVLSALPTLLATGLLLVYAGRDNGSDPAGTGQHSGTAGGDLQLATVAAARTTGQR